MKNFLLIATLQLCTTLSEAQLYNTHLIPYRKGGYWGYSDAAKNIVIEPQFKEAALFNGPIAVVKTDTAYAVINEKGKIIYRHKNSIFIIDSGKHFITWDNSYTNQMFDHEGRPVSKIYNKISRFNSYGYAPIVAGYTKEGLLDRSFREVVPPQYGSIEFYTENVVKVYDNNLKKYGLVNLKTGKQYASQYDMIYPPQDGRLMVRQGDVYGFIDMNGKQVVSPRYQKETPADVSRGEQYNESTYQQFNLDGFYSGLAVVVVNDKAGYIDKKGKTAIPFEFDKAYGFHGNYAWVRKNGKWGMINKRGEYVLKPEYTAPAIQTAKELEALDGFHEGLVPVTKDSLYGYIDTTGKLVIPFQYKRAEPFHDGLAAVYTNDKVTFINRNNEVVIPATYKWVDGVGIAYQKPFENGIGFALNDDNTWTVIDNKGAVLLPMRFSADYIYFESGLADAKSNGKRYVFNEKGNIVHTFDNDDLVTQYTPDLYYNYGEQCYINIKTKVRYCE